MGIIAGILHIRMAIMVVGIHLITTVVIMVAGIRHTTHHGDMDTDLGTDTDIITIAGILAIMVDMDITIIAIIIKVFANNTTIVGAQMEEMWGNIAHQHNQQIM